MAVVDELVTVLSTVLGDGSEKAVDTYKRVLRALLRLSKRRQSDSQWRLLALLHL